MMAPGHVAGRARSEEDRHASDFLRCAHSPHGDLGCVACQHVFLRGSRHVRLGGDASLEPIGEGGPGVDGIDADALGGVGLGEPRRGQHQSGVRGTSGQMHRGGDLAAGSDDVDDDPARARRHMRQHGVNGVDVAEELGVHRLVPGLRREVRGRIALRGPGRIDKHVDGPQLLFDLRDHARSVLGPAQIGGHDQFCKSPPRSVQVLLASRHQNNPGAFRSKSLSTGQSDALAAAGDDDDFSR